MKICPFCLKKFEPSIYNPNGQIYCSLKCRSRVYYKKYYKHFAWKKEKACVVCGKKFIPNKAHQVQCSSKCTGKKWKILHREKYLKKAREYAKRRWRELHPETHIILICKFCRKKFKTDTKHRYQEYCSVKCRSKANYIKSRKNGKYWINKKLYRNRHKEQIKKRDEKYKAKIRFGVTSKTLNKYLVIKRDKGLCQVCGNKYEVIHHIRYSGKPEDLVCLCRSCHASVHHKYRKSPYLI